MAVAMMVLSKATHRVAMHKANMQRARAMPDRCEDWAPISSAASEGAPAGAGTFSSTGSDDSPPEREGGSFSDMLRFAYFGTGGLGVNIACVKRKWTGWGRWESGDLDRKDAGSGIGDV
jgi:hypothetical protein